MWNLLKAGINRRGRRGTQRNTAWKDWSIFNREHSALSAVKKPMNKALNIGRGINRRGTQRCVEIRREKYGIKRLVNIYREHSALSAVKKPMNKALNIRKRDKPQGTQRCVEIRREKYGIKRLVNTYREHSALSASSAVKKLMNKALNIWKRDKPQRTQRYAEKYGIKRLVNIYREHSALSASSAVKKLINNALNTGKVSTRCMDKNCREVPPESPSFLLLRCLPVGRQVALKS